VAIIGERLPRSYPVQYVEEGEKSLRKPLLSAADRESLGCRRPLSRLAPDWPGLLAEGLAAADHEAIRAGERTGRPAGSPRFVARLEKRLYRPLARQKRGPKAKLDRADAKS